MSFLDQWVFGRDARSRPILIFIIVTYITPQGRRATAELAYFTPDVLARPNLKIATNARVTRILFDNSNEVPRAVGVEFTDKPGSKYVTKALKEVILA